VCRIRAVTLAGATLISTPARTIPWGSSPYAGSAPNASPNVTLRLGQYLCPRAEISTEQADRFSSH
jgi:hypothetical protein